MNEKIIIEDIGEFYIKYVSDISDVSEFIVDGDVYTKFTFMYNGEEHMFSDLECYDLECYEYIGGIETVYSISCQSNEQVRIRFIRFVEYFNK